MNIPYVKIYDENGILKNPIVGSFLNPFKNRSQRREVKQKNRFFGNGKNLPLTVTKTVKYLRRIQIVGTKKIEHYTLQ